MQRHLVIGGGNGMRKFKAGIVTLVGLVLGAAILVGCVSIGTPGGQFQPFAPPAQGNQTQPQNQVPAQPPISLPQIGGGQQAGNSDAVVNVYERVSPAVVNITFTGRATDVLGRSAQQEGTGSGFIIDKNGNVVTNQHVVANASRLDVTLADGSSYAGQVVVSDPATDLAIVKIQAPADKLSQLTTVPLGDSDQLKVGQSVVAIGNPFGLERSASLGIVSSLGRSRPGVAQRMITNMIQTDAAINPGNSGGPLLNLNGEVIGINEQIESASQGNVGVGFAIPSNTLKHNLDAMLAGKQPEHAWIGISGTQLTPTLAEQIKSSTNQGVLLATVVPNGPAAKAGLKGATRNDPSSADVITQIDGRAVHSVEDIAAYVDQKNPNDVVHVTYVRGGQTQTADVTLGVWQNTSTTSR
jgi:S1-C subfamily serine protease